MLAQFNSALDAVQCALEIQELAEDRVEGKLRIGIHLGDVIIEHDDVFGDGVNIASRLQAIADSGGIYVSESVQKAIRSRSDIQMRYLTKVRLKNVDYRVKTYSLQGQGLPVTPATKIKELSGSKSQINTALKSPYLHILLIFLGLLIIASLWWVLYMKKTELRIAVLPIKNMSMVENADFIVVGMHSELIDEISKIGALLITSRTSSSTYRDVEMAIPEIAIELNVKMVVESELTEFGDSVRLMVRLIQAFPEERQVWRKEYNKSTKDILTIYGDVAMEISRIAEIKLTEREIALFSAPREVNPQAYQAYLTGMGHLYELSRLGFDKALQYFNLSVARDPEFAPAYMGIARVWGGRRQFGFVSFSQAMPEHKKAFQKAVSLDSTTVEMHYGFALSNTWLFWQWEMAEKEFQRTIEIDPNHAKARAYYAHYLNIMQRSNEALPQIEMALELEPYSSAVQSLYGMYLNHTRQYDIAIEVLKKTLAEDPNYGMALSTLWTVYHNSKMYDEAVDIAKIVYAEKGDNKMVDILINEYVEGGYHKAMARMAEAYILKKDTTYVTPWQIATLYTRASNKEKALDWLEEAFIEHDPNMPYMSADPIFDEISDDPRFQKILKDMKLPF
ncbi:hypothetical protein DRQ25_17845 [Candidatus Fermentibacteria bacterium]|nr:MAG: hypothetical protein DRQ25_17845 [Candidatus Fermentibacteria bacterium]